MFCYTSSVLVSAASVSVLFRLIHVYHATTHSGIPGGHIKCDDQSKTSKSKVRCILCAFRLTVIAGTVPQVVWWIASNEAFTTMQYCLEKNVADCYEYLSSNVSSWHEKGSRSFHIVRPGASRPARLIALHVLRLRRHYYEYYCVRVGILYCT